MDPAQLKATLKQMQDMQEENKKLQAFLAEFKADTEKVRWAGSLAWPFSPSRARFPPLPTQSRSPPTTFPQRLYLLPNALLPIRVVLVPPPDFQAGAREPGAAQCDPRAGAGADGDQGGRTAPGQLGGGAGGAWCVVAQDPKCGEGNSLLEYGQGVSTEHAGKYSQLQVHEDRWSPGWGGLEGHHRSVSGGGLPPTCSKRGTGWAHATCETENARTVFSVCRRMR